MIGEARNKELLSSATTYIYRETPSGDLHAHFFFPHNFDYQRDRCPAIISFTEDSGIFLHPLNSFLIAITSRYAEWSR